MKNRLSRYRDQLPRKWRKLKPMRAAFGAATLALPIAVVASSGANAGVNLVVNASAEQTGTGNFPLCFGKYGYGNNTYSIGTTSKAHSGSKAIQVTISKWSSGARTVMTLENASCAPWVTPGHQYNLGLWYMSNTPNAVMVLYRHDAKAGWQYWTDLKNLPTAGRYAYASVRTPQVPANTDQIAWGVSVYGKGTVITDDYSTVDATVQAAPAAACSAGAACTRGAWQVMSFTGKVRAMHAILMYNGKVLLVAGSGNVATANDVFKPGSFQTAVYNPANGSVTTVPTPADFFCSGHIQLPNGKVLVLGGNAAYPTATHGYEGLKTSYIFNPVTDRYQRIHDLIGAHWYPSATELGNGDIISFGGLDDKGDGTAVAEYFKYNGATGGSWLPESAINEDFNFWGLYPAMILMANGELFYTGSHVFGNNISISGGATHVAVGGDGAAVYNISAMLHPGAAGDSITGIPGLQDTPGGPAGTDMTDQSMSILLPPAQSQKVMLMGGGNIDTGNPGTRLTDLINLNSANPHYVPGPLLPRGPEINQQGKQTAKLEPASDGKMYVSMVILPNGQVLETGGGLLDRQAPYIKEASMYNPSTNKFTGMAADPQPRGYHSTALLLPDGRVMTYGNNPGDGSYNEKISIYSPPYLFHGARPQIKSVASPTAWHYGKSYNIRTNQKIVSAELIRPAAVTHQSDPNQRYVALSISGNGTSVGLNVTSNHNMAPPGWYMLFVNNANGVPSVAKWIHLN